MRWRGGGTAPGDALDGFSSLTGLIGASCEDPYPAYSRLRHTDPVRSIAPGLWAVARYVDCREVLVCRSFVSGGLGSRGVPSLIPGEGLGLGDGNEHLRLRRMLSSALSRVGSEPAVKGLIADHVAALVEPLRAAREPLELVGTLCEPLPVLVIAGLFGIPSEDVPMFRAWASRVPALADRWLLSSGEADPAGDEALRELGDYLAVLAVRRRRRPGGDLVSLLVRGDSFGLGGSTLTAVLVLVLVAGHETTIALLANLVLALLAFPEQRRVVAARPALADSAIEETLRFDPPVQYVVRRAAEDAVVGGWSIQAGERIVVLVGSANRDPSVFDHPDRFDVRAVRRVPHLGFGWGRHSCLGALLARIEARAVLPVLVDLLGGARLDGAPEYGDNLFIRYPQRLRAQHAREAGSGDV